MMSRDAMGTRKRCINGRWLSVSSGSGRSTSTWRIVFVPWLLSIRDREGTLAIYEQLLGTEHASVATILCTLATLYHGQARYPAAEPLYHCALAIHTKELGTEHLSIAMDLNNLATLYRAQSRYAEARELY